MSAAEKDAARLELLVAIAKAKSILTDDTDWLPPAQETAMVLRNQVRGVHEGQAQRLLNIIWPEEV
jgi:hypothetical protein